MPVLIPDERDQVRQAQSNVRTELPNLDPSTEKASFITGIVVGFAKAVHHFMLALENFANRQVHPQTATGSVLFRGWWTQITNISRWPVTSAEGHVVVTGDNGSIVPVDTTLSVNGVSYRVLASTTILNNTIRPVSLTYSNGSAVFETDSPHGLATGLSVNITGSMDAAYNGDFEITVTSSNEFTYVTSSVPSAIAGANVVASSVHGRVPVRAETKGKIGNLDGGTISMDDTIPNVDTLALVDFGGISGGTELEEQELFRDRLLDALASTLGTFTGEELRDVAKSVAGVTRVFIRKAQVNPAPGWPLEGQSKVLFLRDSDANPIPSAQEVKAVKQAIIEKILPANSAEEDLIVIAPVARPIDIVIGNLSPDNASMRSAITHRLQQYFDENISIGSDIPKRPHRDLMLDDLRCAINGTVDLETGQVLNSFEILEPSEDVLLDPDSLAVIGIVSFNQ